MSVGELRHLHWLVLQEELCLKGSEVTVCLYILGPVRTSIFPPELQDALGGAKLQMSPETVARHIIRLLQQGRSYAIVGKRYRLLVLLMQLLPQRWIIRLIGAYLRKGLWLWNLFFSCWLLLICFSLSCVGSCLWLIWKKGRALHRTFKRSFIQWFKLFFQAILASAKIGRASCRERV